MPTESPPDVIADVILDPYRDAKPFVVQPMPGAEKVPVICIITDLLTEPGKPLLSTMVTFPAVFLGMFLVKDRQQQAHSFSVMAVVAVEAEESTTPAAGFFRERFIFTVKD